MIKMVTVNPNEVERQFGPNVNGLPEYVLRDIRSANVTNIIKKPKLSVKQTEVKRVFRPDENDGSSEWVLRENLDANVILNWGNNGMMRNGSCFGDKTHNWEKKPSTGRITHLRMTGFNEGALNRRSRPIRNDIADFYKTQRCVACGSVNDNNTDFTCDHKNDLYNDQRVLDMKTQTFDDFQSLCASCNLKKRTVSIKTRETMTRYGAKNIPSIAVFGVDFTSGDKSFNMTDINAMVGTYWYDPVAFNTFIRDTLFK